MVELVLVSFVLSYFYFRKNPTAGYFIGFVSFYLGIISGLIFYLSLQAAAHVTSGVGEFYRAHFYFIHFMTLLGMGIGFWPRKFRIKFSIYSIGFLLNGISVLIHKKMPIDLNKLHNLGQFDKIDILTRGNVLTHRPLISTDIYWLCDVFTYRLPWTSGKVVSLGDFLISIGLGVLLSAYLHRIKGVNQDV